MFNILMHKVNKWTINTKMPRSRQQYLNVAARAYGQLKGGAVLALQRPACLGEGISENVSTDIGAGQ
jgi:hypothetical protein